MGQVLRWLIRVVLVAALDGAPAQALIPAVEAAIAAYPWNHRGDYTIWPGPNSHTFVATVAGDVPDLGVGLPSTAIGRDDPARGAWLSWSGSTFRATLGGYAGVTLGGCEGEKTNCRPLLTASATGASLHRSKVWHFAMLRFFWQYPVRRAAGRRTF